MIADEIMIKWYEGKKIEGANFVLDSAVIVLRGEFKGSKASVISLESLRPDVTYLVETSEGRSHIIKERFLAAIK